MKLQTRIGNLFPFLLLLLMLLGFQKSIAQTSQKIWLSGQDGETAVNWDFKSTGGRNSGYWTTIPVPSNWDMLGFGNYTYGYGGDLSKTANNPEVGFYKHQFVIKNIADKNFVLNFMGSMTDTEVKINGVLAGELHQGGYTQFSYDITKLLKEGNNVLEATVHKNSSNIVIQNSERIGDFWMFGGIYRPVYIEVFPKEYIERVAIDAKMDGAFKMDVFTANVTKVDNILVAVYDLNNNLVGKAFTVKVNAPGDKIAVASKFDKVKQWSHEFPNLYSIKVTLRKGTKAIHEVNQKFGFRTFEVRDHDGFYLNGKRILLKGASMHSFRPESGRTLSKKDMLENALLMKSMNFNTVRPCHYPPDSYFFEICDSIGLLAYDELPGWKVGLDKKEGSRLVKELIVRDVNHPSIVLWSNGNHVSHNPALDEDFFKWDIQGRRPLKNAAKTEDVFAKYNPKFDIVDTRYYPSYDALVDRLKGPHIVLPNEILHALFDGGGAAGLNDYWNAFESSKVGGGLMIWALFDEGVVDTNNSNAIDLYSDNATDGVVGPHGEKEGSFYAIREIWSPIKLLSTTIATDFKGMLSVQNKFNFVNLNQCKFTWKLQNFSSPFEAFAGNRTNYAGVATASDVEAGSKGDLNLEKLPETWHNFEALEIEAFDNLGNKVMTWRLPIQNRDHLSNKLGSPAKYELVQDASNPFQFTVGNLIYNFDAASGILKTVKVDGTALPISNFPSLVAESTKEVLSFSKAGKVAVVKEGDHFVINSTDANGFDSFSWTINPDGTLKLDYKYQLAKGDYYYAGIGMKATAADFKSKKWLGEGPFRIWNNRTEGGLLDVWEVTKKDNIPGKVWNLPEFEGFFAPWYWTRFDTNKGQRFAIAALSDNLTLGVLNPIKGKNAQNASWHYPVGEGVFFFNYISSVGEKWKPANELGPSGEPHTISEPCSGSLLLNFDNNKSSAEKFKIEIE